MHKHRGGKEVSLAGCVFGGVPLLKLRRIWALRIGNWRIATSPRSVDIAGSPIAGFIGTRELCGCSRHNAMYQQKGR